MHENNPGLSEHAWEKVIRLIAKFNLKYGAKLVERQKQTA